MLVSSKEMLCKAREEGYAVGSFNIFNLESAKAIIAAAEAENAPVMLQIWSGFADFIGLLLHRHGDAVGLRFHDLTVFLALFGAHFRN